ncbi:MAG: alpha-amylase family glycosyl hydrolase [Chloroflexota bacterium]|nr:alpha-amylase family glycosyl hydrolase [Chloroflexota bacterium]
MNAAWTQGIHHDASALYVSNPQPRLNEVVTVRMRVPANAPVRSVFLRSVPDGEQHIDAMRFAGQDGAVAWWEGSLRAANPLNAYRFKVYTDDAAYHVSGWGVSRAENLSLYDFKLLADYHAPTWVHDSVMYHIFIDRFCNGDPDNDVPPGAWTLDGKRTQRRAWSDPLLTWKEGGNADFYGGDLAGVVQKLDYIQALGANALYLSPIFTAPSNHKFDTSDFENVDPHFGGNEALVRLREALDRRGMRMIVDVVVNHIGVGHQWFKAAQADADADMRNYFTFHTHPHSYEMWNGVKSLPKLNYRSEALRDAMYRSHESVLRRWLHEPYRIDGWRLDVFNMMALQGEIQLGHKVTRGMRRAIKGDNPTAYFMGEHFFDATTNLQGDEMDAVMNYLGFTYPLRRWLTTAPFSSTIEGRVDPTRLPGEAMIEQWRAVRAAIPWQVARGQYNLLSSHDITRFFTAVNGDKAMIKLGTTILLTYPGVPGIYYGEEIGLPGGSDPDNRRPMVWDEAGWDTDLLAHYKTLIKLRRESSALIEGAFEELYADDGTVAYQRQSKTQRLIIVGNRDARASFALDAVCAGLADGIAFRDLLSGATYCVEDGALQVGALAAGAALVLEAE